ncbi:MAG TPA: isoprenylcysteine carboxylmethyltransferase family protein [Rhizomicrobium sp.]
MLAKVWIVLAVEAVIFAGLLFGSAGTLGWPPAWAFLGVVSVGAFLITRMVERRDPALVEERLRWPIRRAQLPWDGVVIVILTVVFPGWLALMGLDAVRFDWSWMPDWLQIVGGIGVATALSFVYRVFEENTFLQLVRAHKERGQKLISTGPYAVVRHPFYAAVLFFCISTALLLGSWLGLAGVFVLAVGLVVRTALEDRELRKKLEGYSAYARQVPYRLVPGVW